MSRRSGRHPDAEAVVVRLTDAALSDLQAMQRKGDPQVVRWALKKCLLLEQDPEAGAALRGNLVGFRKLVVGDRDWRIGWRVTHDDSGAIVVDVAEVWAFGARSDAEVYSEVQNRVAALEGSPHTVPLAEALSALGKIAYGLEAAAEPDADGVPDWLVHTLTSVVKMPRQEVDRLTPAQAQQIWDAYISSPRD